MYYSETRSCRLTIRIVFIIMLMAGWSVHVLDVRGAFLKGDFADGETLYMYVPQGMEKWYGKDVYSTYPFLAERAYKVFRRQQSLLLEKHLGRRENVQTSQPST
jgi:hypothetical protein